MRFTLTPALTQGCLALCFPLTQGGREGTPMAPASHPCLPEPVSVRAVILGKAGLQTVPTGSVLTVPSSG